MGNKRKHYSYSKNSKSAANARKAKREKQTINKTLVKNEDDEKTFDSSGIQVQIINKTNEENKYDDHIYEVKIESEVVIAGPGECEHHEEDPPGSPSAPLEKDNSSSEDVEEATKVPPAEEPTVRLPQTRAEKKARVDALMRRGPGTSQLKKCACLVKGCSNTARGDGDQSIQFFKMVTKTGKSQSKWMTLIGRKDLISRKGLNNYICEEHYPPDAFEVCKTKKLLRKNVMPTLKLPTLADEDQLPPEELVITATKAIQTTMDQERSKQADSESNESRRASKKKKALRRRAQKEEFDELCDKFLQREVSELVKTHAEQKFKFPKAQGGQYRYFCMQLFHRCPATYATLQKHLKLPSVKQLRDIYYTAFREGIKKFMQTLKPKISSMSDLGKNCVILINEVKLKPHLYYHIKKDQLYGFGRIGAEQMQQLAQYAVVVMVRGLFEPWVLPIDYALCPFQGDAAKEIVLSEFFNNVLSELMRAGLEVRLCLSNMKSRIITAAQDARPTVEKPYFHHNCCRIYYAYDPVFLMKSVYCCLMDHEFQFQGLIAKWQDIEQFYESDSKKLHRLAPELSERHVRPENRDTVEPLIAIETLSERVAAGIANYVDFGMMDESAMGTVKLLTILNRIYKFMNSVKTQNSCEYQKPFKGSDSQINFVVSALTFFRELQIVKEGLNISNDVKFVKQFQITLRATMLLYEDLKLKNVSSLITKNITLSVLDNFLHNIIEKSNTKDITAWRLIAAFNKMLFRHVLTPQNKKPCPQVVHEIFYHYLQTKSFVDAISLSDFAKVAVIPLPVKSATYKDLKLPKKNQILSICEFLLRKCKEVHENCVFPDNRKSNLSYTRYKGFYGDYICPNPDPSSVPSDSFIKFVESLEAPLEQVFYNYLDTEQLLSGLNYDELSTISPGTDEFPCRCFPTSYMVKLYCRMRIYQLLQANNKMFRNCSSDALVFQYKKLK